MPRTCFFLAFLMFLLSPTADSYKFLAYSPQFAHSHVNFIAKVADALIDAGHDVVIVSAKIDSEITSAGTKKARVIEIPQSATAKVLSEANDRVIKNVWNSPSAFTLLFEISKLVGAYTTVCNETLTHPGLVEQLRAEKFDVAFSESIDFFPFGLFHLVGIKKVAVTQSFAMIDGRYKLTQTPSNPAYVPATLSGYGEKMTFFERVMNFVGFAAMANFGDTQIPTFQRMFEAYQPGFPLITDIIRNVSLIFLNTEPLLDFPRPTTHRIIEIGGIVTSTQKPNKLNETWSEILNRRPKTVLLSFGTFVKAYAMPDLYKKTIVSTLSRFSDVTFIWKYEKPEERVTQGAKNIVEAAWLPQVDILNDPRLSAFITHGGQGSTTEATMAGVPLVVIPVATDQLRNAQIIKRNDLGIVLEKEELADGERLYQAISDVLSDDRYALTARRTAEMLKSVPFTAKEKLIRNMEFLVRFGPLRQFDHYGTKLNFIQFYLIDVFAFFALMAIMLLASAAYIVKSFIRTTYYEKMAKLEKVE